MYGFLHVVCVNPHGRYGGSAEGRGGDSTCLVHYLFMWVQSLLLKTEALDFVEVLPGFKRHHVIGRYACDGLVHRVEGGVESQGGFPRHNLEERNKKKNVIFVIQFNRICDNLYTLVL